MKATLLSLSERPVGTAVAGAGFIAFSAILVRLADVSPSTAAAFRCAYAVPVLVVLARVERRRLGPRPRRDRLVSAAAGVFFAADLVLWHFAIRAVGAGLGTVLGNLQVIVVAFAAWALLGERPANRLFVAIPVVLAGVVGVSGVIGGGDYGSNPGLGVLFGALTSVAYGGFIVIMRYGSTSDRRHLAGPLLDATAVAAVVAATAGAVLGDLDLRPVWPAHGWLLTLAVTSQVTGWLLISASLPRLPAAVTSMLLLLQPVGALAVAALVLAERPSPAQLAGCGLILAGVVIATRRGTDRAGPEPAAVPAPTAAT